MKQNTKIGILGLLPVMVMVMVLISISPFIGCKRSNTAFYDKILNDFDTNSYFIALDIKSPSYKGRVIIENNDLYVFFHKTEGLNKGKYNTLMKRILVHHRALKINDRDLFAWNFIKVPELESVIQVANQGENRFIAHFFDGTMLKYGIREKEQNAIINQLFYWNIPSKIARISGVLIIG